MRHRRKNGFTIYELMITILIIGLVLALGLPSLRSVVQDNRVTTTTSDLQSAFKIARSEAVRARTNVTICASDNSSSDDADCRGEWQDGFIVFVDTDGDLTRDAADDTLIRAHPAVVDGVRLVVANDAKYFGFTSTGTSRGDVDELSAVSQIVVCDERGIAEASQGNSTARLIIATPLGLATATRDHNMVGNAMQQMGKSCR
jgi:prepilin-type N-terminal cleavage/methylation domain-containing protein